MDWVHRWWTTTGSHGPSWTDSGADRRAPGRGGVLTRVGPPATPGHGSSPARAKNGARSMGVPFRASPGLGWWSGDGDEAAAEKKLNSGSAQALGEGEKRGGGLPPPQGGPVGPHGLHRPTGQLGQKPRKNSFKFK
jgi:hypothetical protein